MQSSVIYVVLTILTVYGQQEFSLYEEFGRFVDVYKKDYKTQQEFEYRYQVFRDNWEFVQNRNSQGVVTLKLNQFADLTLNEFRSKYLQQPVSTDSRLESYENLQKDVPTVVDWRLNGTVTKVKRQGEGASGWAFSTVAAVESAIQIKHDTLVDLSAQQLIDCTNSPRYGNSGCKGGNITNSLGYAHEVPIGDEEDYPYLGKNDSGKDWDACISLKFVRKANLIKSGDRLALYTAISEQPVSLHVNAASKDWQFYKDGILDVKGNKNDLNHYVTAVGFNFTEETYLIFWKREVKYVVLKNSWGADWGINGYIHINSNSETGDGSSCIYTDGVYPSV